MIGEIILIFIFSILAALLFPVIISIHSDRREGKMDGFFSIRWIIFNFNYLFIERRSEITILNRRLAGHIHTGEKTEPREKNKKIRSGKIPIRIMIDLARPIFQLLKDLTGCFQINDVHITARIGTNDPAHTGILAGTLYSAAGCLHTGDKVRLAFDFEKPCLEWDMIAKGVIIPIKVFIALMKFFTDRRVLRSGYLIFMA